MHCALWKRKKILDDHNAVYSEMPSPYAESLLHVTRSSDLSQRLVYCSFPNTPCIRILSTGWFLKGISVKH